MPQSKDFKFPFPDNYYDTSFKDISKANIVDHVRYRFYWESYVRNSSAFLKEIEDVAKTADKYGIKVVYDNHQFHTSSWLNAGRGTGFPPYFFTTMHFTNRTVEEHPSQPFQRLGGLTGGIMP